MLFIFSLLLSVLCVALAMLGTLADGWAPAYIATEQVADRAAPYVHVFAIDEAVDGPTLAEVVAAGCPCPWTAEDWSAAALASALVALPFVGFLGPVGVGGVL